MEKRMVSIRFFVLFRSIITRLTYFSGLPSQIYKICLYLMHYILYSETQKTGKKEI